MIKNKIFSLIVVILLLMQSFVFATPSGWAVELVEASIEEGLVPESLKTNYQNEILRYEYVLLALEILEKYDVSEEVVETKPFNDVIGHRYETEIVKAFNAGVISGYDDGTFKPDQNIKREEITALVYNLVKKINPGVSLPTSYSTYSDGHQISNWAKGFVEFNYINSIMSGTGKVNDLDTLNPKGLATREQAIVLLYKLSQNRSLLARENGSVEVVGDINGQITTKQMSLDPLADLTNESVAEAIRNKNTVSEVTMFSDRYISIDYPEGFVTLSMDGSNIELNLVIADLESEPLLNDYFKLLNALYNSEIETIVKEHIETLKLNSGHEVNESIREGLNLRLAIDEDDNTIFGIRLYDSSY